MGRRRHTGQDFWDRVRKTETCWIWMGPVDRDGYGRFQKAQAHRWAYLRLVGPIPPGHELDHVAERCGSRLCVNPDHLEPVLHVENLRRARESRGGIPSKSSPREG